MKTLRSSKFFSKSIFPNHKDFFFLEHNFHKNIISIIENPQKVIRYKR